MERSYGFPSNYLTQILSLYLRTLLLDKSEAKTPEFDANTEPVLKTLLLTKSEAKTPEFDANAEPVLI